LDDTRLIMRCKSQMELHSYMKNCRRFIYWIKRGFTHALQWGKSSFFNENLNYGKENIANENIKIQIAEKSNYSTKKVKPRQN